MPENHAPRHGGCVSITAPRHHDGDLLGHYDVVVVRALWVGSDPAFLVRFEDGHEAGAFRRELRANARGWQHIDALQQDATTRAVSGSRDWDRDLGGASDGYTVSSDADPGL
jgi:hypothetical protein